MRFAINPFTELLDIVSITGSGAPPIETITGNTGGPVGPDPGTFNLNFIGDNTTGLTVSGNPGTFTLTIEGIASSTTQVGTTRYATNAEAAAQTIGTAALTPANITSMFSTHPLPASQGGTGLSSPAAHSLLVTNGSSAFTVLGVASNGQLPIGSIGSDPVLATLTAGTGISIVNGPGTITITNSSPLSNLTFTEDTGSATVSANNINIFGTSAQGISTSGAGSTVTITAANATDTQKGVASFNLSNFTVTAGAVASNAITVTSGNNITATASWNLGGAVAIAVSGTTNHSIQLGNASGSLTSLGVATNGQLPIGSTGADPVLATLTAGTGVSITNGAGSITVAASASVATTYTANSGSATPSANNLNILGTGSLTTSGSGSTITVSLTGLTNHNVLVGAGTATITNVAPSATSGVPLISNGAAADPSFGTAVVAGGGTGATSFTAHSLLLGQGTSPITALGAATNGQLPIGSTGADPVLATITAGSGISVTNGAGSITISATAGGLPWTNVTGTSQTIAVNNAYLSNNAGTVAFTLPASATIGDMFRIAGVQGAWTLAQAAGQQIKFGSAATTAGVTGSLASTDAGDSIECVATNTSASTVWRVISSIGNITVA